MNPICFVGLPQCLPPLLRTICVFTCCTRAPVLVGGPPPLLQLAFSRFCCWLGWGGGNAPVSYPVISSKARCNSIEFAQDGFAVSTYLNQVSCSFLVCPFDKVGGTVRSGGLIFFFLPFSSFDSSDVPSAPVTLSLSCSRWWKMMQIENGGKGGPRIDLSSRYWGSVKERGFVVWRRYPVFDDSAEES
ncbi:hypothetical protein CEXT_577291 [Caerostris extrusa]|uniref:Secreted protein n=1 Tax=Caerostris extrusa TaxID=172846 RepID=A0AAV4PJL4_CAEEX|nr:hypothetical protein CEXT_577291 [Caerostris extrusa]